MKVGRVMTFHRDDSAPLYELEHQWIATSERPVDIYESCWTEVDGKGTLNVGSGPTYRYAVDRSGETEEKFFVIPALPGGFFLYPLSSEALIGTEDFEETCIGYWQTMEEGAPIGSAGMKRLATISRDYTFVTELIDPDFVYILRYPEMQSYQYPNAEYTLQANDEAESIYSLITGDPAPMTGTMIIGGETLNVTWVMENYYHSDIVRVYATETYESAGFSPEDDCLCRMKVRCDTPSYNSRLFTAVVVGEGVFTEGTTFTYERVISGE